MKLKHILSGSFFEHDFWKDNSVFLGFLFMLLFIYLILSSLGDLQIGKIDLQKRKIERLQEKALYYETNLKQYSLPSEINKIIKQKNLDIKEPEKPAFIIIDDE